jgi:hypothetical protein
MSDDPVEYLGREHAVKADPVKRKAAMVQPLAEQPAAKPGSHLKHATKAPRLAYEAAQQEVHDAQSELSQAKLALTEAQKAETAALTKWLSLQPKADPDQLLRDYGQRQVEQRAANIAAGLPPEGVRVPTHGNSALDRTAANRARPSPQIANVPLQSPVARRVV